MLADTAETMLTTVLIAGSKDCRSTALLLPLLLPASAEDSGTVMAAAAAADIASSLRPDVVVDVADVVVGDVTADLRHAANYARHCDSPLVYKTGTLSTFCLTISPRHLTRCQLTLLLLLC